MLKVCSPCTHAPCACLPCTHSQRVSCTTALLPHILASHPLSTPLPHTPLPHTSPPQTSPPKIPTPPLPLYRHHQHPAAAPPPPPPPPTPYQSNSTLPPPNPHLHHAGTHDVPLMVRVLGELRTFPPGGCVAVPRYNKSAHEGELARPCITTRDPWPSAAALRVQRPPALGCCPQWQLCGSRSILLSIFSIDMLHT